MGQGLWTRRKRAREHAVTVPGGVRARSRRRTPRASRALARRAGEWIGGGRAARRGCHSIRASLSPRPPPVVLLRGWGHKVARRDDGDGIGRARFPRRTARDDDAPRLAVGSERRRPARLVSLAASRPSGPGSGWLWCGRRRQSRDAGRHSRASAVRKRRDGDVVLIYKPAS
nr:unnamed protein product [Digitaria exilis]